MANLRVFKNFWTENSPNQSFFLLFSSQNSTFFQILEHYVHRSRQPPHHLMSTLMMIIFSFVFRSDGAMIPKWKFSSGFKQKKNSLPASFLISEKKVYFEIGKIVYLYKYNYVIIPQKTTFFWEAHSVQNFLEKCWF